MRTLRLRRAYASLIALTLGILGLGLFIFFIVARLYTELSELAISLPNYGYLVNIANYQIDAFEKFVRVNPQIQETLNSSVQAILHSLQGWAKSGSLFLLNFLAALPGVFIVLVVSMVATLLTSSSYPGIKRFIKGLFPRKWHASAQTVSKDLGIAIFGFLRAETILISVTGLIFTTGLLLMGNRYAFTIGFIAAFLDLLPIVGTGMIFVPWIIGLFIMGSVSEGLKLLAIWLVAMVLRQFLEPKIMSKSIGLHPLPTLISMYVGLKLLGAAGLILGPGLVIIYEALRKAGIFDPKE
jgi:sporulation integral membrane protein YtvI